MPILYDGKEFSTLDGHKLSVAEAVEWSDYARANKISNKAESDLISANVLRTMQLLEKAYAILACDGLITSFFRSEKLNAAVGGKIHPPSAHMAGRAVDSVPDNKDIKECFDLLASKAAELDFDQLIIERDKKGNVWLHMSVARKGERARRMAFALSKEADTARKTHG
jgi:hypothetical protein